MQASKTKHYFNLIQLKNSSVNRWRYAHVVGVCQPLPKGHKMNFKTLTATALIAGFFATGVFAQAPASTPAPAPAAAPAKAAVMADKAAIKADKEKLATDKKANADPAIIKADKEKLKADKAQAKKDHVAAREAKKEHAAAPVAAPAK